MINASGELKNLMNTSRDFKTYADIKLADGTILNLDPSKIMMNGFSFEDKTTDGDKFCVGSAIGKIINLSIANYDDAFSSYDFYGAIITVYEAIQLSNSMEKIKKGVYYVVTPETPGSIINISAVDDMYKFDITYAASTAFPATLQSILSDCCNECGVTIGFSQFDNYNFVVSNKPADCTYRQVVSWVAQIAGYNARVNNNGALELVWYKHVDVESTLNGGVFDGVSPYGTGDNADGGNFTDYSSGDTYDGGTFNDGRLVLKNNKSVNVATDDITITGVSVKYDGAEATYGTDAYMIRLNDNQLTKGQEQAIADYLGTRLCNICFRPFNVQINCNPLIEPFDTCRIVDRKGNSYFSLINYISYKNRGFTTISCKAESPQRNFSTYISQAAMAKAAANRNTTQKLSTYDQIVQNMNMLAMNAMGYYQTEEMQTDGSRIIYMHDKPTLADSIIIYKRTSQGFFLSQDGGESYTSGFDSNGNAVLNILSAIGIVCDWIRGGTLTLGGLDNVNGVLNVEDASGALKGQWTKDGIEMTQNDGSILRMTPTDGFYRLVGSTKNVYNSLYHATSVSLSGSGSATITLPTEFNGKNVKVSASINSINSGSNGATLRSYSCTANYNSANNTISVSVNAYGRYRREGLGISQSFVTSVSKSSNYFLTSASLNGSYIRTTSEDAVTDISTSTSSIQLYRYYEYDIEATLGVSIIALA